MRLLLPLERLTRTGGTEMSVLQLTRELAKRGHDIDVFFTDEGPLVDEYRSFSRSVRRADMTFRKRALPADLVRNAHSVLAGARGRPDVVYVHRFTGVPFAALTGRLARAPVVCHLRDAFEYRHVRARGRAVRRYIAVSAAVRQHWICSGLDPARVELVHTGVDLDEYRPADEDARMRARRDLQLPSEGFVALYCGRIDREKGVETLLDAWRRLGPAPGGSRLLLVGEPVLHPEGPAYLRRLQQAAPAGCHWLPMRRDVLTPMHASDVVVVPSFTEGFSRTIIEAMATGCPVVASRVGGTPEILDGPFASFMFEPGDSASLARRIGELSDWRQRDPGLAGRCTEHVKERFTLRHMTDGVERVLSDVAKDPVRR